MKLNQIETGQTEQATIPNCPNCNGERELNGEGGYLCCFCGLNEGRTPAVSKQAICNALRAFINQRSGIEWCNYGGSREAFMGDYRPILRHGRHARLLLRFVELRDSITAEMLKEACRSAYSGRLSLVEHEDGYVAVDYCPGQYFPTEYRNAACAVLASAIWHWLAESCGTGDAIRKAARREFGRAIVATWFN